MKLKILHTFPGLRIAITGKLFPVLAILLACFQTNAQDQTAPEVETISPSIEFSSIQHSDNSISLKTILRAKTKNGAMKLYGLKISFSAVSDSGETNIGSAVTNANGTAVFNFKSEGIKLDAEGKLHFKASFAGNKIMDEASEELAVKKARLTLSPLKEDSTNSVALKLIDLSTGQEVAMKEATLSLLVKRSFYPLKIGEGTTDENGEATIAVPQNLPGDAKGNITVLGRLEGNDDYGVIEAATTQNWGTPVSDELKELPRALWSSHPPLWMLITFIILVTTVWGHYIVIIYELFRLRKEH